MRKSFLLLFLTISIVSIGQKTGFTITDSTNGKPLNYASIFFKMSGAFQYSGEDGMFTFYKDSLTRYDTIIMGYVGYDNLLIPVSNIENGAVLKMHPSAKFLQPVVISNCKKYKLVTLNKPKGHIDQFTGPGPEMSIIMISRFSNTNNIHGYIESIEIFNGVFNEVVKVPVRIHWYKWNEELQRPGEELTDRSLLVYPNKKGWNQFEMPDKLLWYSKDGIVLGLEFIYPVDYLKQFQEMVSSDEKIKWLHDIQHRWNLGMKITNDKTARTFYILNNSAMQPYNDVGTNLFLQPAIKFHLLICKKG